MAHIQVINAGTKQQRYKITYEVKGLDGKRARRSITDAV